MKKLKSLVIVIAATALMVSCSVERRHYMAGYNVNWKKGKSDVAANNTTTKVKHTSGVSAQEIISNSSSQAADAVVATTNAASVVAQENQTVSKAFTAKKSTVKSTVKPAETNTLGFKEKVSIVKAAKKMSNSSSSEPSKGVYIILAILIPFVAVGLATDWGIETLWNVLWCLLCGIPGIIHAFIILKRKGIL